MHQKPIILCGLLIALVFPTTVDARSDVVGKAPIGSVRTSPYPLHATAVGRNWKVRVNTVNFAAWPLVKAANSFNTNPSPGWTDVLISISLTFTGKGTQTQPSTRASGSSDAAMLGTHRAITTAAWNQARR